MSIPPYWSQCIERFLNLKDHYSLATPFTGYVPGTLRKSQCRILYVGKATKGECNRSSFEVALGKGESAAFDFASDYFAQIFLDEALRSNPAFSGALPSRFAR